MSFDWISLGKTIANVGLPILGTAVGGPGGAVVGKMIASALGLGADSSPEQIATAISTNPDNVVKLQELYNKHEEFILKAAYDADVAQVQAVNTTMQAESKSEHWLQWSWRPINGILFAPTILCVYVILPILKIPTPSIDPTVWLMWGSVLGITAWHRGVGQVEAIKKGS